MQSWTQTQNEALIHDLDSERDNIVCFNSSFKILYTRVYLVIFFIYVIIFVSLGFVCWFGREWAAMLRKIVGIGDHTGKRFVYSS